MVLGGGTSCVLFSCKQKGLGGFAESFLPLGSGASEQHLAMSRVLSSGRFRPCRAHGAGVTLLSCPAGPSGGWIPGRAEPGFREAPIQGVCTQLGALFVFFWYLGESIANRFTNKFLVIM